jgi:hypothetical protein
MKFSLLMNEGAATNLSGNTSSYLAWDDSSPLEDIIDCGKIITLLWCMMQKYKSRERNDNGGIAQVRYFLLQCVRVCRRNIPLDSMSTLNQQDASKTDTIKTTRHGITTTRSNAPNRRRAT